MRWLVRYHWESGQRERASEVALRAGATGSGAGISLTGWVAERGGRLAEAEASYRRIEERYGEPEALGTYYLRQAERTGDPTWIPQS